VGPPLAKPEHELPSYGRAAIAFVCGAVMMVSFLGSTVATLIENKSLSVRFWRIGFWTIVAAGETAAWRLKWLAVPISVAVLWSANAIVRSIKRDPEKFIGLRPARIGLTAAITVSVVIATLIAITIPTRLRHRQWAIEAQTEARGYAIIRAMMTYRDLHGTFPSQDELITSLRTLPDPDGSIADALHFVDANGYQPTTTLASGPSSVKARPMLARGSALRNTPSSTSADPPGVAFTSYKLRLSGEHKILSDADDIAIMDGVINPTSELARPPLATSARPR
jgi:type II secretory pathway pseudopilin PulG